MIDIVLKQLQAFGLPVSEVYPDEKVYRFKSKREGDPFESAWYACARNFNSKDSAEYWTVVYGDWFQGIAPKDFCTLISPGKAEKAVIKQRVKDLTTRESKERNATLGIAELDAKRLLEEEEPRGGGTEKVPLPVPAGMFVRALGHRGKEYFFTTSENQQIVSVSRFSESDMLDLMPIEYWEAQYPGGSKGATRVDWPQAKSMMMAEARKCGIFQDHKVRGAGVWTDEGRVIVNMGNHLVVDGEVAGLKNIKSRYFYTLGVSLPPLSPMPLSADECTILTEIVDKFKWQNSYHGALLAGALVTSRICGALPIRPHVWVTGGAHTGKTTLLEKLIQPIIGEPVVSAAGNSTEAGIRQTLANNAMPLLFDEFETTGARSAERIQVIIDLMRLAWSNTNGTIIKGGASGVATSTQVMFSAIVLSIRPNLTMDADKGRFAVLELAPHGSDPEHWSELAAMLNKIDVHYGNRLFARTISMVPILLANFKKLKARLSVRAGQRFGDQYGMLLAGYSLLLQDDELTEADAEMLVDMVALHDEQQTAKETDHEDCLRHLLNCKIALDVDGDKQDYSVVEAIRFSAGNTFGQRALERYGISVDREFFYVQNKHPELNRIFTATQWANGVWAKSLPRLENGTVKDHRRYFLNETHPRCVMIPFSFLK